MNYYERHIGDWIKDTVALSMLEDGAYNRLVDQCYQTEKPLPKEKKEIFRAARANSKAEKDAVLYVLGKFFFETPDGYVQKRVELELARFQEKKQKAQASANARWSKDKPASETYANASETHDAQDMRTQCVGNALQSPVTSHQSLIPLPPTGGCPIEPAANPDPADLLGDAKPATGLPDCPYTRLLELWSKHLPHLTQPRVWEGNRKATMRQRWQQAAKPSAYSPKGYASESEGIAWWDSFFAYIANDTSLSEGFTTNSRTWRPDLEWVCNAANFQKIIDGKYTK